MCDHVPYVFEKTKTHEGIITGWKGRELARRKLQNIKFKQEKAGQLVTQWHGKRNGI